MIGEQEIIDFVFAQPRERRVNMGEPFSDNSCGCVMVHYGKEKIGLKEYFSCSSLYIGEEHAIDSSCGIFRLLDVTSRNYNYGQIQDILTEKGKSSATAKRKNMHTVNTLHSDGFKVDVHHLRFPKQKTRRTKPMNVSQFKDTNQISPKSGKTVVAITKDGRIEFGECRCMDSDHYCRAEGFDRAAARALEKFNS